VPPRPWGVARASHGRRHDAAGFSHKGLVFGAHVGQDRESAASWPGAGRGSAPRAIPLAEQLSDRGPPMLESHSRAIHVSGNPARRGPARRQRARSRCHTSIFPSALRDPEGGLRERRPAPIRSISSAAPRRCYYRRGIRRRGGVWRASFHRIRHDDPGPLARSKSCDLGFEGPPERLALRGDVGITVASRVAAQA